MFVVQKPRKKRDIALFMSVIAICVIVGIVFLIKQSEKKPSTQNPFILFVCSQNKTIQAFFQLKTDKVDLVLSDGRKLTIPRALSASGARYANSEESFVFWNKGNTAFIEEQGVVTYENCLTE